MVQLSQFYDYSTTIQWIVSQREGDMERYMLILLNVQIVSKGGVETQNGILIIFEFITVAI